MARTYTTLSFPRKRESSDPCPNLLRSYYIFLQYQNVIVLSKITGGTFSNIGPVLLNKAGKSSETDFENDYGK